MIPCVIYPMLLLLAYYSIMLRPELRILSFERIVSYDEAGNITITCVRISNDDERPIPEPIVISSEQIDSMTTSGKYIKFTLTNDNPSGLKFIFVPIV